jgi:hypothetical protein
MRTARAVGAGSTNAFRAFASLHCRPCIRRSVVRGLYAATPAHARTRPAVVVEERAE